MVKALKNADFLIQSACASLEAQDWSIEKLAKESDYAVPFKNKPNGFDALDQIVSCAKDLTEDVRQTASFIQVYFCFLHLLELFFLVNLCFVGYFHGNHHTV